MFSAQSRGVERPQVFTCLYGEARGMATGTGGQQSVWDRGVTALAVVGGLFGTVSALYIVSIATSVGLVRRQGYSAAAAPQLGTMILGAVGTGLVAVVLCAPYLTRRFRRWRAARGS